jgi:hypothetical protein
MTMQEFIDEHRIEIASGINAYLNHVPKTASCNCPLSGTEHIHFDDYTDMNDEEIRQWILNDEGLYQWARSERVNI